MGFRDYSGKLKSFFLRHSLELQTDNVFERQFLYARNFINGKNSILVLFLSMMLMIYGSMGSLSKTGLKHKQTAKTEEEQQIIKKNHVMLYINHTL